MIEAVRDIFLEAVAAGDPEVLVRHTLQGPDRPDLSGRVILVGAGKAAIPMARAVLSQCAVERGVVVTKHGHGGDLGPITVYEGGHPLPDKDGLRGAGALADLLDQATEDVTVVAVVSGGGSALLALPVDGVSLDELRERTEALLRSGRPIQEVNAERRQLLALADGGLVRRAAPARVIGLVLSDVLGNELRDIASGPTVGAAENHLVGTPEIVVHAAAEGARRRGFETRVLTTSLEGEARDVARSIVDALPETVERPTCRIAGGETTVTVTGSGRGGRNQELALAAAIRLRGRRDVVFLSAGTDGTDGPTDAAGAIVTGQTADENAERALADNDSHPYLRDRDALLVTGPTGTNLLDLVVVVVHP